MIYLTEFNWQKFKVDGKEVSYDRNQFEKFVKEVPPYGLSSTVDKLRDMCEDDDELLAWIARAKVGKKGGFQDNKNAKKTNRDNITVRFEGSDSESENPKKRIRDHKAENSRRASGTGRDNALKTLSEKRPDLFQAVLSKKISAHAAMVQAGFRQRTVMISADDAGRAARSILGKCDVDYYNTMHALKIKFFCEKYELNLERAISVYTLLWYKSLYI